MNSADIARAFTIYVEIAGLYRENGDSTRIIALWNELNALYAKGGGAVPTEAQVKELLPKAISPNAAPPFPLPKTTGYGIPVEGSLPSDADLKNTPHNFSIGDVKLTSTGLPSSWMVIHRGDAIPTGYESAGPIFDSAPPVPAPAPPAHPVG